MDRATLTLGTTDGHTCVLDRSALGLPDNPFGRRGDSSLGPPRSDALLPRSATRSSVHLPGEETPREQDVVPLDIWSRLPVGDRQRFGHRFSFLVLKALGLRPCLTTEVDS